MVHNAALDDQWPRLSPTGQHLLRRGAEIALDPRAEWLEELHKAALGGPRMRPVAEDPVLAAGTRLANLANLRHWAAANVSHPGRRVPANTGADLLGTARDLVRRGLDESSLEAYRTAQGVVWRRWMQICFELTSDAAQLREVLDVSALSIATFIDDTVAAISAQMKVEQAELTHGAHAERRAVVTLLLEGAPIARRRAETQLGYGLAGPQTAAIIWTSSGTPSDHLGAAAETVTRTAGTAHQLTIVAGATALWVWLPTDASPHLRQLATGLAPHSDVRVALGRPGNGIEGFRRSHLDAVTTQRMMTRLTSPQQLAHYDDIQLAALLTSQPDQADEFLNDTLGDLRAADPRIHDAVLTYIRELGNTTRAAELLFTHRNTVVRRLTRADELLPRPLRDNVAAVAAALEVLRWRGPGNPDTASSSK